MTVASSIDPLTPKQRRFVEAYLLDMNATHAAIRAGYSPKTARAIGAENLTKPNIQAAVQEAQTERAKRVGIDQDYVLKRLHENAERAMQAAPVRDRNGNGTGEYIYQGNVANRALELLGKHLGMFTEKVEHSGARPLTVVVRHE